MAKKKEIIRIHNQGKREYQIPGKNGKGKTRLIEPGRSIEIEADIAEKMLKAYPRDLINFESLVSEGSRNKNKEIRRLENENEALKKRIEELSQTDAEKGIPDDTKDNKELPKTDAEKPKVVKNESI